MAAALTQAVRSGSSPALQAAVVAAAETQAQTLGLAAVRLGSRPPTPDQATKPKPCFRQAAQLALLPEVAAADRPRSGAVATVEQAVALLARLGQTRPATVAAAVVVGLARQHRATAATARAGTS